MIGSTQQVARILFEKLEPDARPQGQDRLLDRHARPALDPPRARDRRGDRGVARVLEAAEHVPRPAAVDARAGRPAAHDDQPGRRVDGPAVDDEPEPSGDPDSHRPRPRDPQRVHRRAGPPADERGLLADRAAHPRARQRRAEAAGGVRARRRHPHGDGGRGARRRAGQADAGAAQRREDDQLRDRLRHLRVRPLREPGDPARGGAGVHRRVPRALPARAGLHRAHEGAGDARRLRHVAARAAAARAGDPRVEPPDALSSASASRSTS